MDSGGCQCPLKFIFPDDIRQGYNITGYGVSDIGTHDNVYAAGKRYGAGNYRATAIDVVVLLC